MTKIGVVGNCQARGIARGIAGMLEGVETTVISVGRLRTASEEDKSAWLSALQDCDVVLCQWPEFHFIERFSFERLDEIGLKVIKYPSIVFAGLHPDCVTIAIPEGRIHGPMWTYHSAIVAAAFLEGLPPDRAEGLFNAFTYASLGYFDAYEVGAQSFRDMAQNLGYDVEGMLSRPKMMHTVDHARIETLQDVTLQALAKLNLPVRWPVHMPRDDLATFIWPVYPEIAAAVGVEGSLQFQSWRYESDPPGPRMLSLREFVQESYAALEGVGAFTRPQIARARSYIQEYVLVS